MTTCSTCKNFKPIRGTIDGVCNEGKGYREATAQGYPKPKEGTGYVHSYNIGCELYSEQTYTKNER